MKSTINDMIATCALPPSVKNLVLTTPSTSRFYLLPKIQKPNNPGRPIVSACSCPTENISAYLDEVLAPFVKSLPTYVKDTNHALHIFDSFRFDTATPGHHFLFTMDVKSLYTVITQGCGLQALAYFLDTRYQGTFKVHPHKISRASAHLKFILLQQRVLSSTGWRCSGK